MARKQKLNEARSAPKDRPDRVAAAGTAPRPSADGAARADATVRDALEAVRRLVRALRLGANRARETVGVSSAELFVLGVLQEGGPAASLNELAARTYTDQSSASPVVERLRRRRLIRRQRSPVDARRVTIELTDSGQALLDLAPSPPQAGLILALRRMAPADRDALARGLSRLVTEMGLAELRSAMLFEDPPKGRARQEG
jgi:MarR family transcriptional regulator, lower aerobic nicotinate degradation pathway regulator